MKRLLCCCALLAPLSAALAADHAPPADYADLPPFALVEKALRQHPAVRIAQAGIEVGEAGREQLEAGPHEFNLRLGSQQRREIALDRRLHEKEIGIERAIRLPGKAAVDAAIGATLDDQAHHAHGDALHETGRLLLKSWFDWRRESAAAAEWRQQATLLEQQEGIAARRVAAGDAARMEMLLAAAQRSQAEAQLGQAESRVQRAAGNLAEHFPALPLPERVAMAPLQPVEPGYDRWREAILEHSHELRVARSAAKRQQLQAQRADAERIPDPTIGVKWAAERDGQERVLGVTLSIPFAGAARAAQARAAQAETAAAGAREAQALARVEADARRGFQEARSAYAQAQRLGDVAARMEENTRLLEKAWRLGEGQIGDLLTARRQTVEARLAATQAQLDAAETRYRLLLDTHQLWPFDDAEEHPPH